MKQIMALSDEMFDLCKTYDLQTVVSALLSLSTTLVMNDDDPETKFIYVSVLREIIDNIDPTPEVLQ